MTAPLLVARDLRVDIDGAPACDGLSFETQADKVLVLGAPRALFLAVTGLVSAVRGSIETRPLAGAALDPPLPPRFTVREYVAWSAKLAGTDARAVDDAIDRLKLGPLAKTRLDRAVLHARRGAVIAAALATGEDAIAIEDPLAGLASDVAATFAEVLVGALADRAWIVFAPRMALASPIAIAAEEAIVARATGIDAQGVPAEIAANDRRFVVRLDGGGEAVAAELGARGARVAALGAHLVVDLGTSMTAGEVVGVCAAAGVSVIELLPVARALA